MMHSIEGQRPGESDKHFRVRTERMRARRAEGVKAMNAKRNRRRGQS